MPNIYRLFTRRPFARRLLLPAPMGDCLIDYDLCRGGWCEPAVCFSILGILWVTSYDYLGYCTTRPPGGRPAWTNIPISGTNICIKACSDFLYPRFGSGTNTSFSIFYRFSLIQTFWHLRWSYPSVTHIFAMFLQFISSFECQLT